MNFERSTTDWAMFEMSRFFVQIHFKQSPNEILTEYVKLSSEMVDPPHAPRKLSVTLHTESGR